VNYMQNMNGSLGSLDDFSKRWMAIASEMADYAKRSLEDSSAAFARVTSAKSVEQAIEIQTEFAKRAYEAHMKQMTKIGGMYAELAKGAFASPLGPWKL
jgi:hypothetical protein